MMTSTFKRLYSAVEAAEMIMNDWSDDGDNVVDWVMLPPEKVDAMADDEEIDANGNKLGSTLPGDVAGLIEVHTNTANAIDDEFNTTSEPAKNDVTLSSNDEKESHILKLLSEINDQKNAKTKWMNKIPSRNNLLLPIEGESLKIKETRSDIVETFAGKQPHEIFEEYVNAELKKKILVEKNRYAAQKNTNFVLSMADLNTLNAILILTDYHSLPRTRLFWEKDEDVGVAMVYEAMSRKDFEEIKRYIHFADNGNLDNNDKFAKVRKLYDIRNKTLQQFGFFHTYYSIDEQMVPYTGKNSCKQTIRTKIIRFGYKNFVVSSDDGYPYLLDPYCGAKYGGGKVSKNLCARSVLDCVTEIGDWTNKEVYFDNWFSSFSLLKVLKDQSIRETGTIRADRLGKDFKIKKRKEDVRKEDRCNAITKKMASVLFPGMTMVL